MKNSSTEPPKIAGCLDEEFIYGESHILAIFVILCYTFVMKKSNFVPPRVFTSKSKVKQSFASEMDLTRIVAKHSGSLPDTRYSMEAQPYSCYASLPYVSTYHDALNKISDATSAFEKLPSMVRRYFANSPELFLESLHDVNRHPELVKLGILLPPDDTSKEKSGVIPDTGVTA